MYPDTSFEKGKFKPTVHTLINIVYMHQKRRFSKTVPRVKIFENTCF